MTAYLKKLYELFIERQPNLSNLSEQRIVDQRKIIFMNKTYTNR